MKKNVKQLAIAGAVALGIIASGLGTASTVFAAKQPTPGIGTNNMIPQPPDLPRLPGSLGESSGSGKPIGGWHGGW